MAFNVFFRIIIIEFEVLQKFIFNYSQVGGLIRLTSGAALSFGLAHFGSSEFELMAEELLMSDSVIKVSRTIRQYISWNNSTLFTWIMLLLLFFFPFSVRNHFL
jgi:hypothetical protein